MSETTAAIGAEGVDLGPNILGFDEFQATAWATQDSIERLVEGEEE